MINYERFTAGAAAHEQGLTIADCPWSAGDPEGHDWRSGWIQAEAQARMAAGTYGATPEEHAAAIRSFGKELNPDPFPELLPEREPTEPALPAFQAPRGPVRFAVQNAGASWVGVAAAGGMGHAIQYGQSEEFKEACRKMREQFDQIGLIMGSTIPRVAEAVTAAMLAFANQLGLDDPTPDPRNATAVLAWRADQAASRQAGLDRVATRSHRLSGPPPGTTLSGRSRRRGRRARG